MDQQLPIAALQPFLAPDILSVTAIGVLILTAIVVVLSVIMVAHHIVTDRERKRNRERFESASVMLAPHLVTNDDRLDEAVAAAVKKNSERAVALVLRRARYDLMGPVTERISKMLSDIGEVKKLTKEATSRRDWRRAAGVRGLGECGGPDVRALLVAAADDESGEVRRAAREGLLSDGSHDAIRAAIHSFLIDLPRRAGWRRSFYARLAVVAADELTDLVRSGQLAPGEEKLALEALGDAGRSSVLPLAVARLSSAEGETRATAVRVVGKVGTEREMPLILEALGDTEWFVRAAAARSLEIMLSFGHTHAGLQQTACDKLGAHLTDGSWWVRANAARALSRAGNAGLGVLLRASEATDRYARDAAIAALAMAPLSPDARLTIKKRIESIVNASAPITTQRSAIRPGDLFA